MIILERKGTEVFYNGTKLTIVAQATKGPGKECVKVEGLEGANGAKWVSLSKLKEGTNELELQARNVTSAGAYTLTPDEAEEVKKLKARIEEIITGAKARYVAKPKLDVNVQDMTLEERIAKVEELKKYYGL